MEKRVYKKEQFKKGESRCNLCNDVKPVIEFTKENSRRSGVSYLCIDCQSIKRAIKMNRPGAREIYTKHWKRHKEKVKDTIGFKKRNLLSGAVRRAITNGWMSAKTEGYIGCTMDQFLKHIQDQFVEGMTFENYGTWQLDHKLPVSKFNMEDDYEVRLCYHYTNYQPLWAKANATKKTDILPELEQIRLPI